MNFHKGTFENSSDLNLEEMFSDYFGKDCDILDLSQSPNISTIMVDLPNREVKSKDLTMLEKRLSRKIIHKLDRGVDTFMIECDNGYIGFGDITQTPKAIVPYPLIDTDGQVRFNDVVEDVHLLVSGSSGSGKSNFIHSLISSVLRFTDNVSIKIIDPKKEYLYNQNSRFSRISDLTNIVKEMELRYNKDVPKEPILLIIDEYGSMRDKLESDLETLTKLSRAANIHSVIGIQRGCSKSISTTIRSNCTIGSFRTRTSRDSVMMIHDAKAFNCPVGVINFTNESYGTVKMHDDDLVTLNEMHPIENVTINIDPEILAYKGSLNIRDIERSFRATYRDALRIRRLIKEHRK